MTDEDGAVHAGTGTQALKAAELRLYGVVVVLGWVRIVRYSHGVNLLTGWPGPVEQHLQRGHFPAGPFPLDPHILPRYTPHCHALLAIAQKGVVDTATEELLSPQEAGDRLGVSVYTVRRWIKEGKLRAFRPGKEYRVRVADLEEFFAAREVHPKARPEPLWFRRWLEDRFGHAYLALSEEEIEMLFEELSGREDEEEWKRELFSAITSEYLATAKTLNLPAEERVLIRGHHKEATKKWLLAASASGQTEMSEEFEQSIKEVLEAATERETA